MRNFIVGVIVIGAIAGLFWLVFNSDVFKKQPKCLEIGMITTTDGKTQETCIAERRMGLAKLFLRELDADKWVPYGWVDESTIVYYTEPDRLAQFAQNLKKEIDKFDKRMEKSLKNVEEKIDERVQVHITDNSINNYDDQIGELRDAINKLAMQNN